MAKDKVLVHFRDIVEPRRTNNDAVSYMTRYWVPQPAYKVKLLTPTQLKSVTLQSKKLDEILSDLSPVLKKSKDELGKEVAAMLEEIGLDRRLYIIRWLGVFTTKVICKMYSSIFINEKMMFSLKSSMGLNPVVFVPTHRSYADFILMSYICFFYDMELPAVAAGMDFHAMVGMGRLMRDTGAFYMRRTFATDPLYGAVFRQYVRTLVVHHHSPLEFFIEGTRSRSGKSMAPKYGFMSMVLEPLFSNEIADITFVPIHISYDKVLEERLFAYELLGVPKPKESTSGLFKALNILNEFFGSIFINIGEPFSAKEYIRAHSKKSVVENIKPNQNQTLSAEQNYMVQSLSHTIITKQQEIAIITTFQMVATALTVSLHNQKPLSLVELSEYIIWLSQVLKDLGGIVFEYTETTMEKEMSETLAAHTNLIKLDRAQRLRLINSTPLVLTEEIKAKMKGHKLTEHTMNTIIPVVMTQLYVNPILHLIISAAIIDLLLEKGSGSKDILFDNYKRFRQLLRYEFPVNELMLKQEFDKSLDYLLHVSNETSHDVESVRNKLKLDQLLSSSLWPFITCLYRTTVCLLEVSSIEEKEALRTVQKALEWQITNKQDTHPYCLSLDCILNCVQGLVLVGGLNKERKSNGVVYHINQEQLTETSDWLYSLLPDIKVNFDHLNPVMVDNAGPPSKL